MMLQSWLEYKHNKAARLLTKMQLHFLARLACCDSTNNWVGIELDFLNLDGQGV